MITLLRIDPARRMDRWYSITVQPTLFERWTVVCAWGSRRNAYQRWLCLPAESQAAAQKLAKEIICRKLKKGYNRIIEEK